MVKNGNARLVVTMPKDTIILLEQTAYDLAMSKSQLIFNLIVNFLIEEGYCDTDDFQEV